MPENDRDRDVIRILYEVEQRLSDRQAKCCKSILEAIKDLDATLQSDVKTLLASIEFEGEAILKAIQALVPPELATKLVLQYTLQGGNIMGAPVNGVVGNVFVPTVVESNATVPNIQPIGPLVYSSDNEAVVAADPNTGTATCAAPGTANVTVLDQGNGLTDTVAFTVSPAPPPVADKLDLEYALASAQKRKK